LVVLGLTWLGGCSLHQAKPIIGTVQDASTGEPIDNALVVAEWRLTSGFFHTTEAGVLAIKEIRTDKQGRFTVPGWGTRITFANNAANSPIIQIFKPGYSLGYFPTDNFERGYRLSLDSDWSGKTLLLKPVVGELALINEVESLESLAHIFTWRWRKEPCLWEIIPDTAAEILNAKKRFSANKVPNYLPGMDSFSAECSNPMQVLKEYLK